MNKTIILSSLLIWASCSPKKPVSEIPLKNYTLEYSAEMELPVKAQLGEGSIWNWETQRLWWIDIEGMKLNIYDPVTKENKVIDVGQRIGTVVPAKKGGAVIALQDGIYQLDLKSGKKTLICRPEAGLEKMRFNDGKCDPAGRLWVGSMSLDFVAGAASLYRVAEGGDYKKMIGNVTVSNGIVWTSDHKTMYYNDSPTHEIKGFDYDESSGEISNERVVVRIPESMGSPDGMTIDSEDKLWVAQWGGHRVGKWDPLTGKLLAEVQVPALNVTSCAFGGPDLDILYITCALEGMNEETLKKFPEAGSVFKVKPGVKGVRAVFWGK
jgi:sugar lactone lactonase YvrE